MSPFSFTPTVGATVRAGLVVEQHITVAAAATVTGYSPQYLRRLLRRERLAGMKVGQQWLISLQHLDEYLARSVDSDDRRRGPRCRPAGEGSL